MVILNLTPYDVKISMILNNMDMKFCLFWKEDGKCEFAANPFT